MKFPKEHLPELKEDILKVNVKWDKFKEAMKEPDFNMSRFLWDLFFMINTSSNYKWYNFNETHNVGDCAMETALKNTVLSIIA